MIDPSVVNYIKKQLHDGYNEDEVRQALANEGWTRDEIEEAFYIIHGESNPIRPSKDQKPRIFLHQEGPWVAFKDEDTPEEEPEEKEVPEEQPPDKPVSRENLDDILDYSPSAPSKEEKEMIEQGRHPSDVEPAAEERAEKPAPAKTPKLAMTFAIVGGLILIANMAMNVLGYGDLLGLVYKEVSLLSFVTPDIINLFAASAGFCSIMFGALLKARPGMDLYFGVAMCLMGLSAFLCGNGYMIGGPVMILGGCLAIIRK